MKISALPLALLLFGTWVMAIIGLPLAFDLFKDFKIEMPAVTLLTLQVLHPEFLLFGTAFVVVTGLLLAQRNKLGWNFSFAVCLICDFLVVGLALPLIALSQFVSVSTIASNGGVILLVVTAVLTQAIFVALLTKRQDLLKPAF